MHVLLFISSVILVVQDAQSVPMQPDLPAYLVNFTQIPIRLDGKLNEPAWHAAPWSRDFVWIDAGDRPPVRSRFKVLYDKDALYFAFEYESPVLPSLPLNPDFPRACEVFLDPEGRGRRYLEFAVDPRGAQHVMIWTGRASVREWKTEPGPIAGANISRKGVGPGKELFLYELRFQWKSLATVAGKLTLPPRRGDAWRANFSRVEQGEIAGDFSWSPAGFYYMHHPNTFGWLVFAGEKDRLQQVPWASLKPLPDLTSEMRQHPSFPLFNPTFWARFPLTPADERDFYLVTKCTVSRLNSAGNQHFILTRREGLPQFIRSIAGVKDTLYVAGDGIGDGLYRVDRNARSRKLSEKDGYALGSMPQLVSLDNRSCLAMVGNRFQVVDQDHFQPPVQTDSAVLCGVLVGEGRLAIGTKTAFEIYASNGMLTKRTPVEGGMTSAVASGANAIGISGNLGLFRMAPTGDCQYYPAPLRIKFDSLSIDGLGRCWATYQGGFVLIDKGRMQRFHEPLGLSGFTVLSAATSKHNQVVFLCTIPNGTWYMSSRYARFLLMYNGSTWKAITFQDGLPGAISALVVVRGEIYLSTSAGVFRYKE